MPYLCNVLFIDALWFHLSSVQAYATTFQDDFAKIDRAYNSPNLTESNIELYDELESAKI